MSQLKAYLFVIALLVVIFGAIGGYLFVRFSALAAMDFSPPPVTIAASTARLEARASVLNAVGSITAVRGIELTSETSGEVTEIAFKSGEAIAKGQLLVVLNDEVEVASRRSQVASLELAEILFERDTKLLAQKSIPQSRYDQSRADLERAKAQLAETEARLANKRIAAPFSGIAGITLIDVGDYVEPGDAIVNLQDHSELEIIFTAPAHHAPRLKAGLAVKVSVDAYPGREFTATVTAVDALIDPATRNVLVQARLDEAAGLLPGMFATLEVDLGDERQLVTIPETAITYSLQGNTVYVIEEIEDGSLTAAARIVESGQVLDGRVAIHEGLAADERVVTVGQNKLYRGVQVLIDDSVNL